MPFEEELKQKAAHVEELLFPFVPEAGRYDEAVIRAAEYALQGGGKRIRPVMLLESFFLNGGTEEEKASPFAAALEMIHTYSLVHDDLPAMDDDALRRGRATTHIVFGEGMALLAGDALLNLAYETMANAADSQEAVEAMRVMASKAGIAGMIGGQCADLCAEEKETSLEEEILYIHTHKTSALMEASLMCGALLAGAEKARVKQMEEAGNALGLAFQIRDDILDVEGESDVLGKETGQDARNAKTTYVSLHGLEEAKKEVARLSEEALRLLDAGEDLFLSRLIHWMTDRTY